MSLSLPIGTTAPPRVVLLRQRGVATDEFLSRMLEVELTKEGFAVFIDRELQTNLEWAREVGYQLKSAEAVIALISPESSHSEFLSAEVETAHDASQETGKPRLISVRIGGFDELPDHLGAAFTGQARLDWHGPDDNTKLVRELSQLVKEVPASRPPIRLTISKGLRLSARTAPPPRASSNPLPATSSTTPEAVRLDSAGGAVPLGSPYYVERPADKDLRSALTRYDSIVLIKGARQMGKTSMLARGLQFARERGAKVALTDFQKFNQTNLENVGVFYLSMAESLADQLELNVLPADTWDERRGPNANFERFVRREVLDRLNAPLVWGLDEVDRLFSTSFGSEVFGLLRSWHNERALDPSGPWGGLTLAIAYATEAHLFITDMNQSPFNIGTRLALDDFTPDQVCDLNQRYGAPLKSPAEIDRFLTLTGGHPFLSRRGLFDLASRKIDLAEFENGADGDDGIFGEHLRRILVLLAKDAALTNVVRGVLRGQGCPTPESFYRLRSAGIIQGENQSQVRMRAQLYADFLGRHLLIGRS